MKRYDVIVIGGGPAGLASALAARQNGAKHVLIIERDKELGGILNQCIHNGFGLHRFKEELCGPEYAGRYIDEIKQCDVEVLLDTMVIELTKDKQVYCTNSIQGYTILQAKAIICTMGCRERTRGAIAIPGDRPAGVFTAGTAQRYVNMEGYLVGKRIVILGSGDIGLIMARRMTLEGAQVLACIELMPYSNGLQRNMVQCLQDFDIPLYLSHTITSIKGKKRVEQVCIAKVDEQKVPIPGTELRLNCDCVLLSVGLIPENEVTRTAGVLIDPHTNGPIVFENMETSIPGIFACGNVLHVHDLVDFVSDESAKAGKAAAAYCTQETIQSEKVITTSQGEGVGYTIPQKIRMDQLKEDIELSFRVRQPYSHASIAVHDGKRQIAIYKRETLAPAAMEKILLPKKLLDNIEGDMIEVSIVKEQSI